MEPQSQRYRVFGREGAFDRIEMRDLIRAGEVTSLTDVTVDGSEQWKSAGMYPELARYLALAASEHAPAHDAGATKATSLSASTTRKAMLIAGLLLAIGIIAGMLSARDLVRGAASHRWPTAEARLMESEVVRSVSHSRRRRSTHYHLRVVYLYSVAGHTYSSEKVSFGSEWSRSPFIMLNEIRGANPLLAYYDPSLPNVAVLHPGVTGGTILIFGVSLIALATGGLLLARPKLIEQGLQKVSNASTIRLGRQL